MTLWGRQCLFDDFSFIGCELHTGVPSYFQKIMKITKQSFIFHRPGEDGDDDWFMEEGEGRTPTFTFKEL